MYVTASEMNHPFSCAEPLAIMSYAIAGAMYSCHGVGCIPCLQGTIASCFTLLLVQAIDYGVTVVVTVNSDGKHASSTAWHGSYASIHALLIP
jgi:hypothetical protein